jgi:hypothetical protein
MPSREELTVTREQVIAKLDAGNDWSTAALELGIPTGLAFMIATGIPADGGGVPELPTVSPSVDLPASPQQFVNHRGHNPLSNDRVDAWVRARASRELTR